MKKYLNQSRQLYMDLWSLHLQAIVDYQKNHNRDEVLEKLSNESMKIGQQYRHTALEDYSCKMIIAVVDEVERIVKGGLNRT